MTSLVMWPPHAWKVTQTLSNCQGHWYNTKAGTPLSSLFLLWVQPDILPIFETNPINFPFFFRMTQCLFPTMLFVSQILPVTEAVPTWRSQPWESSMQGLPERDWVCFSDQRVVRLENFFPKSIHGTVMVKSNAVRIDFIMEFNLFFRFIFKVMCLFAQGYRESYLISSGKHLRVAWYSGGPKQNFPKVSCKISPSWF